MHTAPFDLFKESDSVQSAAQKLADTGGRSAVSGTDSI